MSTLVTNFNKSYTSKVKEVRPPLPAIEDIEPLPHMVYLEVLSDSECMGTEHIELLNNASSVKNAVFQAYVLKIGEKLKLQNPGFQEGDRVFLNGGFTPVPNHGDYVWSEGGRKRITAGPQIVCGIIKEKKVAN